MSERVRIFLYCLIFTLIYHYKMKQDNTNKRKCLKNKLPNENVEVE